jgi:hypothetical protein
MLEEQLRQQNQQAAQNLLNANRGQETTTPSNMAGGAFQSAADMLAFLYGSGALGGGKKPLASTPLSGYATLPR